MNSLNSSSNLKNVYCQLQGNPGHNDGWVDEWCNLMLSDSLEDGSSASKPLPKLGPGAGLEALLPHPLSDTHAVLY